MSVWEWLILGFIFLLGIAACVFVERLRRKGHRPPGGMCSGCPNTATVDRVTTPEDARRPIGEDEPPDIMP